jgi:hypothetical protein
VSNGKTPLYLTILAVLLAGGVVFAVQPYSAPSRWYRYTGPSRSYLRAALRQDSISLARQSLSSAPVTWGLHAARAHPQAMIVWTRYARPAWGLEQGDTAIVFLDTSTEVCDRDPIVLRFVTTEAGPRVLEASSACFEGP